MRDLFKFADRAAACDAKVLITGESGVGKDVVARYIHAHSHRRTGNYVPVNCAGVAETLLESELFGHVKGSFTGAYRDQAGMLQLAHRGTLFLDEVGEMSVRMQALLLRFLENGEIHAVGDYRARVTVDVRIIAATNRNLGELVRSGQFREDLLYRLQVIHLHVPPLRDNRAAIRPLVRHFARAAGRDVSLTDAAWHTLEQYRWPGNVRELQNVVEQLVWLAPDEGSIDVMHLPPTITTAACMLLPSVERRRQVADELYDAIVNGGYSFWKHIRPLFLNRDVTRHDIRELVRRGLTVSGSYRSLLRLFRMPPEDYKHFMNFLATHQCRAELREFRRGDAEATAPRRPPLVLPPLPESPPPPPADTPAAFSHKVA